MGLFDVFQSKEKRTAKNRQKLIERASDKYKQSPDRLRALEQLLEDGSDEALYGLLCRFGMKYDKSIEDEQEKEWVCDVLVEKGTDVIEPVRRYLKNAGSVSWPLRVLSKVVASPEEELQLLEDVLTRHEPGYERDPTKKIQILSHLLSMNLDSAAAVAAPYLDDMDEGVRYEAAKVLLDKKLEAVAREPLLDLFVSPDEESLRLRVLVANGFHTLGWSVGSHRAGVETFLPDSFKVDRAGFIKKTA